MGGIQVRVDIRKMVVTIALLMVATEASQQQQQLKQVGDNSCSISGSAGSCSPLAIVAVPAVVVTTVNVGDCWALGNMISPFDPFGINLPYSILL